MASTCPPLLLSEWIATAPSDVDHAPAGEPGTHVNSEVNSRKAVRTRSALPRLAVVAQRWPACEEEDMKEVGAVSSSDSEVVADRRGQVAAPALRNIEMPVMIIQGMNTMKPRKDTQWGITRMRAVA